MATELPGGFRLRAAVGVGGWPILKPNGREEQVFGHATVSIPQSKTAFDNFAQHFDDVNYNLCM